jgi:GNAT superfamily N-acetyltransferase
VEPQAEAFGVRDAVAADAVELSRFAAAIFHESFGWGNDPADMAAYTSEAYSPARQRAEIEDASTVTLVVEAGGELIGFAQLVRGPAPVCVAGAAPVELKRFYVATSWHGRGVAGALFEVVQARALGMGGRTLWLGVWAPNARAIAFYRRAGFVEVGTQVFQLGRDAQTDLVMSRSLHS